MSETSSVVYHVPDFTDVDGVEYTEITVIVETDADIRGTLGFAKTLEQFERTPGGNWNRTPR